MRDIIDKLRRFELVGPDEALTLAAADIHTLGELGLAHRRRRFGDKAFYVYNQHLNYANVCANACGDDCGDDCGNASAGGRAANPDRRHTRHRGALRSAADAAHRHDFDHGYGGSFTALSYAGSHAGSHTGRDSRRGAGRRDAGCGQCSRTSGQAAVGPRRWLAAAGR